LSDQISWKNRRVLITGAGGFIGSHLTERLISLGASVRALVRYTSSGRWGWLDDSPVKDDIEVLLGDVRDFFGVREAMQGREVVFHLAALIGIPYSYRAPQSYLQTNIEGSTNILQAARELEVERVICTSTSEVYGTARYVPIDEDHPLQGQSPYSASKIAADKMAESYYMSFGLPVVIGRPFNTFGPRQSARAVVPTIITQALVSSEVRIGSLLPTRDFNFVADIVEAFICAATARDAIGEVINFGTGVEISIGQLADTLGHLLGKELNLIAESPRMRPKNSEVERLCADATKARELLGWKPRVSLEDGLRQTIAWMERNLQGYRIGDYSV
jgi:NAD dependent epimerase/dehydratase